MCPRTNDNITVRYTIPGRFDNAPWSTLCKVMGEGDIYELYIQISRDDEHPDWVKLGALLDKTFTELLEDKEFIHCCLELEASKTKANYKKLGEFLIIKNA